MSSAKPIKHANLIQQAMSVTRQMASAFPKLKAAADAKGQKLHHLGAGYPHPEVSDPRPYISHKQAYFEHLAAIQNQPVEQEMKTLLMPMYGYTDTMGPVSTRQIFAKIYGNDFSCHIDPDGLIPTIGATGGIALICSLFERANDKIAFIVDAPTYTGFLSRASLNQSTDFYSVSLDDEGPDPVQFRAQILAARAAGFTVPFYYTVPDGHNPGGISFSQSRRETIMAICQELGIFIVEDAPYTYISFESPETRPKTFMSIDAGHTVHLFTASKIGLPGPRIGFLYTEVDITIKDAVTVPLRDLLITEASNTTLLHNPEALRGFEAYLMDENFAARESLWPVAEVKNALYKENLDLLLFGLEKYLGAYPEYFSWTKPGAGFFSVFSFLKKDIKTDQAFVEHLITTYGVVVIPMFSFYPRDARLRQADIGLNQLRLSFCFNEGFGDSRRSDMKDAVRAFANAMLIESNLPGLV